MAPSFLAAGLAVAALAAPAVAQAPGSRETRDFVQAAAQSDAYEMLAAETALTQSADPRVRAFAQRMIADHGRTSRALAQAAARAGLELPVLSVGAEQAPLLAALQGVRGEDFDRTYARQQVLAHHAALVTEQNYAHGGDEAGLRRVAADSVPVIAAHLAIADKLQAETGGS